MAKVKTPVLSPEQMQEKVEHVDRSLDAMYDRMNGMDKTLESIQNLVSAVTDRIRDMENREAEKPVAPEGVTTIDPDLNFQHCLDMALSALVNMEGPSILRTLQNEQYSTELINHAVQFAEMLHTTICRKYSVAKVD